MAETLETMIGVPVSEKDILQAATCISILGDFWPQTGLAPPGADGVQHPWPPAEEQLRHYWSYMRRAMPMERVPAAWNRVRCLTEAMAKDRDIMLIFKGEEKGDRRSIYYDPQNPVFLRVCSTMPIMLNQPGAASVTANVFVPHDVIKSLAVGPT